MDRCLFGEEKFLCPLVDVLFDDDRCPLPPPPDRPLIFEDLEFITVAIGGGGGGQYGPRFPVIDVAGEWLKGGGGGGTTVGKTATGCACCDGIIV